MCMRNDEEVVRRAVKKMLHEDDGGGGDYGGYFDMGGMGGAGMGPAFIGDEHVKAMGAAFAAPFQELFAGVKKSVVHARTLVKVVFETVMTTLIPFLGSDYKEIFEKRDQEIEKITSEYAEIHRATMDTFKNKDFVFTAFLMAPSAFLTTAFITKTPKAAIDLLKFVGGDVVSDNVAAFSGWFKETKSDLKRTFSGSSRYESVNRTVGEVLSETTVDREEALRSFSDSTGKKLLELFGSPEVKKALQGDKARRMQQDASLVLVGSLENTLKHAKAAIAKAGSIEELNKMSGGEVKSEVEKSAKEVSQPSKDTTEADENGEQEQQKKPISTLPNMEQIAGAVTQAAKAKVKEFYIKKVQDQLHNEVKQGIPEGHPYVKAAKKLIEQLKSL